MWIDDIVEYIFAESEVVIDDVDEETEPDTEDYNFFPGNPFGMDLANLA